MPSLFSRLKNKDGSKSKKKGADVDSFAEQLPKGPQWTDAWTRTTVEPEEVVELITLSTEELKSRALDIPFLLLPFRPTSDPSAVRTFVRHFFDKQNGGPAIRGEALQQELRMTEPMVISGVIKWCWSRLQGGVVGWDVYDMFKVGEQDSNMARDSFKTFIPLSIDNRARTEIIFQFFDLLSAVAAHGKMNGFGGRKLSRMAAWWAFEHDDGGQGFEGGYKSWLKAADATSHLFFAYLRCLAPLPALGAISTLPLSLQKLLQETEYPPQRPALLQSSTHRVAMIVETVSPTPFALLRRANHFQYREEDKALREFSEFDDPVQALTEECRRVLRAVSAANQSQAVSSSKHSTSLRDASWSRFEDMGFSGAIEEDSTDDEATLAARREKAIKAQVAANADFGRPTTPSWADFLSSGFEDKNPSSHNILLPPDKILPPIEGTVRQKSSQSHQARFDDVLQPGELASITRFDLDDAFWWVWMSSLAPEETPERKAAFGRCAVIETLIRAGRWLVMEEIVRGAAPEVVEGAYIAEKKGLFSWTRRGKNLSRRKSTSGKNALEKPDGNLKASHTTGSIGVSKTSIGPDQQAKIQAAAYQLQMQEKQKSQPQIAQRRGRNDAELMAEKTSSVFTLQPSILNAASPAVQWANKYDQDRDAIREAYLADSNAGRGVNDSSYTPSHRYSSMLDISQNAPELPPKSAAQMAVQSPRSDSQPAHPGTSNTVSSGKRQAQATERAVEAPQEVHPAERQSNASRETPLATPTRESKSMDLVRKSVDYIRETMASPELVDDKKSKKLHKEHKTSGGGFRKLFGRAKRSSKIADNTPDQLNAMLAANNEKAQTRKPVPVQPKPATPEKPPMQREETQFVTPREEATDPMPATPAAEPVQAEPTYEQPLEEAEETSQVDSTEVTPPQEHVSQFNQGPLLDQPAYMPDDSASDETGEEQQAAAVPAPISVPAPTPVHIQEQKPMRRERPTSQVTATDSASSIPNSPEPIPLSPASSNPQDRWAQIRKNAAERAAQRLKEEKVNGNGQPLDGAKSLQPTRARLELDGYSSTEETIESRVARIKARVAELTNNAEQNGGGPPPRRNIPVYTRR
ncbi:hypothetical protein QBC32DRAFT_34936 [Pseudoneurospora amorphoporcata]|uniref:Meiotically up-regulated protein Msb1/Mug8 domain-containing protein n=1 Tax=Pseudoneurospora amorphoporcata TaxID=241081 RepID=A0AAN6SDE8_9PEZI|nr:hypothetical protein QBC32DRAFT_34936 [Pseudoneurospora amorphoporcata]